MEHLVKNTTGWSILLVMLTLCYVSPINAQSNGWRSLPCPSSYMDPDEDCLAGNAGIDYPTYAIIPKTSFRCVEHPVAFLGYFADVDTHCQVFHICLHDGTQNTFICPNGTIFNQKFLVCDWWFNVKCAESYEFYAVNDYLRPPSGSRPGLVHPNVVTVSRKDGAPANQESVLYEDLITKTEPSSVHPSSEMVKGPPLPKMDLIEEIQQRTKTNSWTSRLPIGTDVRYESNGLWANMLTALMGKPR